MPVKATTLNGINQPHEIYITPEQVAFCQVANLFIDNNFYASDKITVLDPCMGTGIYGKVIKDVFPNAYVVGVDIQGYDELYKLDDNFTSNILNYDEVFYDLSIFDYRCDKPFDIIITNPPFSLTEQLLPHLYHSDYLIYNGYISFLNRIELLESKRRYTGLFQNHPLHSLYISVDRIPWQNHPNGKLGKADYKMYGFYTWKYGYNNYNFISKLVSWKDK